MENKISLNHGNGGKVANALLHDLFFKYFDNPILTEVNDSAKLTLQNKKISFTTDSFVISPLFFKGGDIGKLAVCGTINDLAVSGAEPLYLSCAFIIEEGFPIKRLERIVKSMARTAKKSGVQIVAGDTKVVEKGGVDGVFITTSGIGTLYDAVNINACNAAIGDVILINGTLGDHGMSILCQRNHIELFGNLRSDCVPLHDLIKAMLSACPSIHMLRDATRGGACAVLHEIAEKSNISIEIDETSLPVKEEVKAACEILGLDPLYIANEGKLCCFVPPESVSIVLKAMKNHPLGVDACIIGKVVEKTAYPVYLNTLLGGKRVLDLPSGQLLPRIC